VRHLGVLVLLSPLLGAQNPDELLVVRLPATQGYLNRHATALPFPTRRSQTTPPSAALHPRGARGNDATRRDDAVVGKTSHLEVAPLGRGKKLPESPPALEFSSTLFAGIPNDCRFTA
jgi:hypothetical protein